MAGQKFRVFASSVVLSISTLQCSAESQVDQIKNLLDIQFFAAGLAGVCIQIEKVGASNYTANFRAIPSGQCSKAGEYGFDDYNTALQYSVLRFQKALDLISELSLSGSCPTTVTRLQSYIASPSAAVTATIFPSQAQWDSYRYQVDSGSFKNALYSEFTGTLGLSDSEVTNMGAGAYSAYEKIDLALLNNQVAALSPPEATCFDTSTLIGLLPGYDPNYVTTTLVAASPIGNRAFYTGQCTYGSSSSQSCLVTFTEY
ncbi:MAG: hypothetical protein KDK37_00670 [Leptospiraceae bacterium]|nr:hypothetical protein [Leptospiraceae bacterium]